jgi:hypothetical protein
MVVVAVAPASLHDSLTGGDLLANGLYVALATFVLLKCIVLQRSWLVVCFCAALLGIVLSSRLHFLVIVPLLLIALWRASYYRETILAAALVVLGFLGVTLPFYLHDPYQFAPLHTLNKFASLNRGTSDLLAVLVLIVGWLLLAWRVTIGSIASCCAFAITLLIVVASLRNFMHGHSSALSNLSYLTTALGFALLSIAQSVPVAAQKVAEIRKASH